MHFIFKIFYWFSKKVLPWYLKILIVPFPNQNSKFPSLCLPKILICAILWFLKLWFEFSKIMICILTYISNFNFFFFKNYVFSLWKLWFFTSKISILFLKKNYFSFLKSWFFSQNYDLFLLKILIFFLKNLNQNTYFLLLFSLFLHDFLNCKLKMQNKKQGWK